MPVVRRCLQVVSGAGDKEVLACNCSTGSGRNNRMIGLSRRSLGSCTMGVAYTPLRSSPLRSRQKLVYVGTANRVFPSADKHVMTKLGVQMSE